MTPPAPTRRGDGLSIWWLIVPTAVYAFLRRDLSIVIVAGASAALWWWKQQPLPATASPTLRRLKPFSYALLLGVGFIMLGGVTAVVAGALVLGFVVYLARNGPALVARLEPWWAFREQKIPPPARKVLAFVVPAAIGWYIGGNAGGKEWGMTLLSITIGITVACLLLFTPPDSLRPGKRG